VAAIDSRTAKFLWPPREPHKGVGDGMLMMDPSGSFVGSDSGLSSDNPSFVLLRIADGDTVPIKPSFNWPNIPHAMGPRARIFASIDQMSQELLAIRLHSGTSERTFLRLGIDGGIHISTAVFDRSGRHIAWGRLDGIVCVCDLAEVHGRLGSLSDLGAAVSNNLDEGAVKSR
jgi:hypothetical protein